MDSRNESERIDHNNKLTSMPANPWEFDVDLGTSPNEALNRILSIVYEVAKHDADSWPSDNDWRISLPSWFKEKVPELNKEETDQLLASTPRDKWDTLPWEFFSWIDAMRDRGWKWWGYSQSGNLATIVLHIATYPERIDAFREILRAAGVKIEREQYGEIS
ncbi:hypothetical protein [Noviherbaspirillum galbum]|uniref:Uncharacterized protein n=1 Tax=Noviherbaspirillum galbum TaxID=2709383 RepID=A0A6B3SMK8_9BURK|nr:hypothetical protein [Noviherbaspirillum galbum]NEX59622.1 hypothetical protein [Noviherbaspirillum galbum]